MVIESNFEAPYRNADGVAKPVVFQSEVKFCNLMKTIKEKETRNQVTSFGFSDSESFTSEKENENIKKTTSQIPDGGYGWVVVISSLVVSLIADGISFSFGLIYTELLSYFKESKSKTAWIGSLFLAVPLLVGPIMSNLVDRYGCRKMTIIGGVLSSTGFALSALCQSVEMLYLTFGIISGVGLGIGYVTAVVSIAFWFDKRRTFATGIGASGTGIGTFLYAPFTQWLIDYYGWRGATLILAGTMLHTCVFGALMRDPDWLIEENKTESCSQSVTTFSSSSVCLDEIKKMLETGANKEAVLDTLVTTFNTEANQQVLGGTEKCSLKKYQSEMMLPTYWIDKKELCSVMSHHSLSNNNSQAEQYIKSSECTDGCMASREVLREKLSQNRRYIYKKLSLGSIASTMSSSDGYSQMKGNSRFSLNENAVYHTNCDQKIESNCHQIIRRHNSLTLFVHDTYFHNDNLSLINKLKQNYLNISNKEAVISSPESGYMKNIVSKRSKMSHVKKSIRLNKTNFRYSPIRNSNFLKNMRIHRNSINYRGALLNTHRYRLRASSCPNIFRNSMTTIAKENESWYGNFKDIIKSVFDFSLFLNLKFALFNLSTLLLFIWFIIPYFYIPEHMKNYNYEDEDSAKLISIIGIFNTLGMVGLGFIGDRDWLNVNICYALCMIVCGITVGLMPVFVKNYGALMILCTIFGLTFASSFSFTPSILVSLVNLDDFTCAYGLVLLVQGIGIIVGPPLAAFIYDLTLRWDDSFYGAGFFITLSGILAYFIEILERRDQKSLNISACESK